MATVHLTAEPMQQKKTTPGPWRWKGDDLASPDAAVLCCSVPPTAPDKRLISLAPMVRESLRRLRRSTLMRQTAGGLIEQQEAELEADVLLALVDGDPVPCRGDYILRDLAEEGWLQ